MKHGLQLLGATAVALMALTGCSSLSPVPTETATQDAAPSQDAGSPAAETAASTGGAPEATGTSDAPSVDSLGEPLITQEFTVPMTKNKVEASIYSLKVHGKVMELTMTVTPHFANPDPTEPMNYWTIFNESSTGPQLIDRVNLKEYRAVKPPSASNLYTLDGTPMLWVGWYAAPEDPIETIDIRMLDGVPNFLNIPVTR